jgi:dipeptidyl aminopeptidase/acylaminoacyl peptidase
MVERAEMLRGQGYGVLLYDARGTGGSGGEIISVGYFETADLTAAVRFLHQQGVKKIACLGISQGGATILLAASKLDGVGCVIAESSYDTIRNAVDRRFRETFHIPGWLGGSLMTVFAEQKLGVKADEISPIREIPKLHCPVFIIAGTRDTKTWAEDTRRLYEAAKQPKQLWMVEGAGHQDLYDAKPAEYERRVLEFLKKYL